MSLKTTAASIAQYMKYACYVNNKTIWSPKVFKFKVTLSRKLVPLVVLLAGPPFAGSFSLSGGRSFWNLEINPRTLAGMTTAIVISHTFPHQQHENKPLTVKVKVVVLCCNLLDSAKASGAAKCCCLSRSTGSSVHWSQLHKSKTQLQPTYGPNLNTLCELHSGPKP